MRAFSPKLRRALDTLRADGWIDRYGGVFDANGEYAGFRLAARSIESLRVRGWLASFSKGLRLTPTGRDALAELGSGAASIDEA